MTLQRAARTGGGDFLDLKELCRSGDVVAIFRIVRHDPPEDGQWGVRCPTVADILICTGPRTGEVARGERIMGALTSSLRGVANPRPDKGVGYVPPTTAPGSEIVVRLKLINAGRGNETVVGDVPSDAEMLSADSAYNGGAGWTPTTTPAGMPPWATAR
jgi:hypothetical protein